MPDVALPDGEKDLASLIDRIYASVDFGPKPSVKSGVWLVAETISGLRVQTPSIRNETSRRPRPAATARSCCLGPISRNWINTRSNSII
jgi:hypothetical protein